MKTFLQRVALVLFGLLIAWAIVEVFARATNLAAPPQLGAEFDRSPALFLPEADRQHPWSGDENEPFVIAAIGDSFTVGSGVQADDAYPARLERLLNLNASATPAEVRVYAQNGSSTGDQVNFLYKAIAQEPNLILLGVFLNDTENDEVEPLRRDLKPRDPTGWKLGLLRASHSLAWIYRRAEERRIQRAWVDYMQQLYQRDFHGWKRFDKALEIFADTCREANIPLVAIVLPPAGLLGAQYPFQFAHDHIQKALSRQGIDFFDLLETFRGRSGRRLAVLPGVDGHFNEIGNRIIAEAVFDYLLSAGHIPAEYQPVRITPQPEEYWLEKLRAAKPSLSP